MRHRDDKLPPVVAAEVAVANEKCCHTAGIQGENAFAEWAAACHIRWKNDLLENSTEFCVQRREKSICYIEYQPTYPNLVCLGTFFITITTFIILCNFNVICAPLRSAHALRFIIINTNKQEREIERAGGREREWEACSHFFNCSLNIVRSYLRFSSLFCWTVQKNCKIKKNEIIKCFLLVLLLLLQLFTFYTVVH